MVEQPKPALVEQCDRDAAADYMSAQDYDWGYCGDVREGRVEHPLPGLFAAHRIAAETAFAEREAAKDAEMERLRVQLAETIMQQDDEWQKAKQVNTDLRAQVAELMDELAYHGVYPK